MNLDKPGESEGQECLVVPSWDCKELDTTLATEQTTMVQQINHAWCYDNKQHSRQVLIGEIRKLGNYWNSEAYKLQNQRIYKRKVRYQVFMPENTSYDESNDSVHAR